MLGTDEHYSSSVKCQFTTGTNEQEKDGSIQEAKLGVAEFRLPWSGMMCRSLRFTPLTPLHATQLYTRDSPVRKQIKQYLKKKKKNACLPC